MCRSRWKGNGQLLVVFTSAMEPWSGSLTLGTKKHPKMFVSELIQILSLQPKCVIYQQHAANTSNIYSKNVFFRTQFVKG